MSAGYSVMDYMGPFIVITIGSVLIVGVLCVLLGRVIAAKVRLFWVAYVPIVGFAFFMYFIGMYTVPILKQTGDLLVPGEYEIKITAGEIERIDPAVKTPPYWIDGKICGADYISIDGTSYYVISEGLLTEGMIVALEYADFENNVILRWEEVSAMRAEQILEEQALLNITNQVETMPGVIPQERKLFAYVLYYLGLIGFAGFIAFMYMGRYRVEKYIFNLDRTTHGRITPNRIGVVISIVPLAFLAILMLGLSMGNDQFHGFWILLIAGGLMIAYMLADQFTFLEINGQHLKLRRLGREKQYLITDVCSVRWKPCRGIIGKQLVIVFNDGKSYWFNMDCYSGVQNTYNVLSDVIKMQ